MSSFKTARCAGCGAPLQDKDAQQVGYTPKIDAKAGLCQRCFQLKHYAKTTSKVRVDESALNALVESLDFKKGTVCHVVDILDLRGSLLPSVCRHDDVYFVVNKADMLPRGAALPAITERICAALSSMTGISQPRVILASANSRMGVRKLSELALAVKKNGKKLYFVGATNAGKSSLVNGLAASLGLVQRMSVSPLASTTLQVNAIKTREATVIDTPGAIKGDNAYAHASEATRRELEVTKGYRQINYQLKNEQSITVADLAHLAVVGQTVGGAITLYVPFAASVRRSALAKGQPRWEKLAEASKNRLAEHSFTADGTKLNLVVSGLLLASVKGFTGTLKVSAPEGVLVYAMPAIV